jgi:hypothetical protein
MVGNIGNIVTKAKHKCFTWMIQIIPYHILQLNDKKAYTTIGYSPITNITRNHGFFDPYGFFVPMSNLTKVPFWTSQFGLDHFITRKNIFCDLIFD